MKDKSSRKKRKQELHIPRTVEEAEKSLNVSIPVGGGNPLALKTKPREFTKAEISELARAIYEYMLEKDMTKPGRSWEDTILISMLVDTYKKQAISQLVESENIDPSVAELKVVFQDIPPEIIPSPDEIKQAFETLTNRKPKYEHIAYDEIIAEVAKMRGIDFDTSSLQKRDLLAEIQKIVDKSIQKHEESKWILYLEAIILGVISSGLFELLKMALASLVMRAPYTEAQIYEVESDVLRTLEKWRRIPESTKELSMDNQDKNISLWFVLHALCVLSVLGSVVPNNPLFIDQSKLSLSMVKNMFSNHNKLIADYEKWLEERNKSDLE
jgi:hypothetical protein